MDQESKSRFVSIDEEQCEEMRQSAPPGELFGIVSGPDGDYVDLDAVEQVRGVFPELVDALLSRLRSR